ncbi:MAG: glycosyltransferase family 4 protein [Armatimonadota bacterium]
MVLYVLAFITAMLLAWFITPIMRRIAIKHNIMVHPGGRRVHTRPTPLWGGFAIYSGFAISSVIFLLLFYLLNGKLDISGVGLIVSGAIIVTLGMLDDIRDMSPKAQILAIIIAGVVVVSFGIRIQFVTNPFGQPQSLYVPSIISWIITLIWIFGVTKTFDMLDGLDGLASGIGAIAAGTLSIMTYYAGQPQVAMMSAALCGACIGFLRFNFNPAKIFMGTGGSQFIGFALAVISVIASFKMAAAMAIIVSILVLGIPIFDGLFVMVRRIVNRQPISVADKTHLHHRLLKLGLSHKQTVILIWALMLLLCGIALFILLGK